MSITSRSEAAHSGPSRIQTSVCREGPLVIFIAGCLHCHVKVRQARLRMHELVDKGQQKVSEAVNARREAFGMAKPEGHAS